MRRISKPLPAFTSTLLFRWNHTSGGTLQSSSLDASELSVASASSPVQGGDTSTMKEVPATDSDPVQRAGGRGESSVPARSSESNVAPTGAPQRWIQKDYVDEESLPIIDENGQYIVSRVQWPTGEIAYRTPPPPSPSETRFGYNVLSVRKDVSWWKHYQKYPRFSIAYFNIQFFFLIGAAWLVAILTEEYRRTTDAMKTPGAMVGEYRGRGPATNQTQKISFTHQEMDHLVNKAQNNWLDAVAETSYIGSKDYRMKKIPRPKEFSYDDIRVR